jgi:hypothetical protein
MKNPAKALATQSLVCRLVPILHPGVDNSSFSKPFACFSVTQRTKYRNAYSGLFPDISSFDFLL